MTLPASFRAHKFFPFIESLIKRGLFRGRIEAEPNIAVFNAHIEAVKSTVPADRLLVFSVDQGWEPLCAFLGTDVPDSPFPHANEGEGMFEKLKMGFWGSEGPQESSL